MTEKTFPAKGTALNDVLSFAEEELRKAGCPGKAIMPMRLRWAGPEYNPLTQGDELTLKLGRAAVTDSQFTCEAGVNLLVVTL